MTITEQLYNEIIEKMSRYHPSKNFSLIKKAFVIAESAHKDQVRKSGEPYIVHPLKVAIILAELELDIESVVAGILHDVIEDTNYSFDDIKNMFSEEIAIIVNGVTNLGKIAYSSKEEQQAENFRKMFLAMAKDIRVILIKLADRLHNMRTMEFMPPHKQKEKSQETIDIYAPLAQRLGISKLRIELEDLAFKYLYPQDYQELSEKIEKKQSERVEFIERIVKEIKTAMSAASIVGVVEGRPKHFFSIYKKMHNQNKTLDQIYDLFAIRAVVNSVKDCYSVLGTVHVMYKPLPGRFKDYIAMPKSNMYQSIHNTLISSTGEQFEIQIRTKEMNRVAEYGIAAHWKYKEGIKGTTVNTEEAKLNWLREILEWQQEMSDSKEFLDTVKHDLDVYSDQVYVFTPQGKVINLPRGATPIDFAYSIHSAIGNKMVGAKVNNRIVTFDHEVRNGDVIEIMTSNNSKGPSSDWLSIVKSAQAKNKIKQWFKKEFREDNVVKGKELLEKDAKKKGYAISDLVKSEWVEIVISKYGFQDWESLTAAVGHGGVREGQVINRLIEEYQGDHKKNITAEELLEEAMAEAKPHEEYKSKSGIIINGIDDPMVRFPRCCSPVPGDEIVGYVTRGRGVTIHRTDCVNIIHLPESEKNRLLETFWDKNVTDTSVTFNADLKIVGKDRNGLALDILRVVADEGLPVKNMNIKTTKNEEAIFDLVIELTGKKQLDRLTVKLRSVEGVYEIERVMS